MFEARHAGTYAEAKPTKRRTLVENCAVRSSGPNPRRQSEAAPDESCTCGSDPRISVRSTVALATQLSSPVLFRTCSKPTSGIMFPLRRPSKTSSVLERCSQSRIRSAAPNTGAPFYGCAPFRRDGYRDGRLRRENFAALVSTSNLETNKHRQHFEQLDRSLHINSRRVAPRGQSQEPGQAL